MYSKLETTKITVIAFLMALEIILTRFLSLFLPFLRLGLGFLPVAIVGILYGPLWSGASYALGDLLGMMIFPSGPYFPGFTLTAFLTGITYGLILHKKKISWKRCFLAASMVCLVLNLCLDTFWLYIIMDTGIIGILPYRILKAVIMLPVQTALLYIIGNKLLPKLNMLSSK